MLQVTTSLEKIQKYQIIKVCGLQWWGAIAERGTGDKKISFVSSSNLK